MPTDAKKNGEFHVKRVQYLLFSVRFIDNITMSLVKVDHVPILNERIHCLAHGK